MTLPAGPWLVVGLARSGVAAARALRLAGERVVAVDAGRPQVPALDADVVLGSDGVALLDGVRAVCKSPGVPRSAPVIAEALRRGLPVLGELEVAWRLLPGHPFLVITGTNGKTTTTELLGAIHREAGIAHAVVGNVGTAAASLVGTGLPPGAVVVCEASSFQLEDTEELAPDGALLLNVAEDHLDRHGTFEAYVAAKLRAFARQGADAVAVAPPGLAIPGRARRFDPVPIRDGALEVAGERAAVRLRGPHNLRNAAGAAALALARGVEPAAVRAALASFAGVPHRLEEVAERDGVLYVNDSKATNVASTLVALRAFPPGTVHVILGGQGKRQDFTPLGAAVAAACRGAYLIGEDAEAIAAVLADPVRCGTLEAAVAAARQRARPGDVVLLSPACASFDQFRDYEARGDVFRALAQG